MPRRCSVCDHPRLDEIDAALVARQSFRNISGRFGLSVASVHRHSHGHVLPALAQARHAREVARGDDLLAEIADLKERAMAVLARAEEAEDLRAAVSAIREARGSLELLARLAGELQSAPTVNVIMTREWQAVQAGILAALRPFPDAAVAVSAALETRHAP